ncbi:MAG: ACT domain-containing protein [Oscillospiraceae bacterium]|nr:ACT domain-containing protein [Oscillospiraceae bacterium]
MPIRQISVFVENKSGKLAEVTGVLADAGIDIRALSIADTADYGILRLIVSKPEAALAALRAAGLTVSATEVLAVRLDDKPGALHRVLGALGKAHIAVAYIYAFLGRERVSAYVILRVEDNGQAASVLADSGAALLEEPEVYGI